MSHNVCYSSKNRPTRSTRLLNDDGSFNVRVGDIVSYPSCFRDGDKYVTIKEICFVRYVNNFLLELVPIDDFLSRNHISRFFIVDLRYANKVCRHLFDICVCNDTVVRVGDTVKEVNTLGMDFDWRVVKFARGRVYCFPLEVGFMPMSVVAFKPSDIILKEKNKNDKENNN